MARDILPDDRPLVFTQISEPGKVDTIVLSESQTHGINKIVHDIDRRNAGNEPKFPVGALVYVNHGK